MTQRIAFIDISLADYQALVAALDPAVEVRFINPGQDGWEQVPDALEGRSEIDAIDIFSHGAPARMHLGSGMLNAGTLPAYGAALARIARHLAHDAYLLLYGCEVGGAHAAAQLATAGADFNATAPKASGTAGLGRFSGTLFGAIDITVTASGALSVGDGFTLNLLNTIPGTPPAAGNAISAGNGQLFGFDMKELKQVGDPFREVDDDAVLEREEGADTLTGSSGSDGWQW